jgi:hypothetical protein
MSLKPTGRIYRQYLGTVWRRRNLLAGVFVGVFFLTLANAETNNAEHNVSKIDEHRIIGRWVRTDGGYILEFKEIGKDGVLKAAYFNPNSINVYQAKIQNSKSAITVFVELRDINYPGSTYNLIYEPETDRLLGTYFQAVERVTYDIEFVRSR